MDESRDRRPFRTTMIGSHDAPAVSELDSHALYLQGARDRPCRVARCNDQTFSDPRRVSGGHPRSRDGLVTPRCGARCNRQREPEDHRGDRGRTGHQAMFAGRSELRYTHRGRTARYRRAEYRFTVGNAGRAMDADVVSGKRLVARRHGVLERQAG